MSTRKLKNEIDDILHTIKDNPGKLKQVLNFLKEEIYEEPEGIVIPEEYKELVAEIAELVDCGYICYYNAKTNEMEKSPKELIQDPENFESMTGTSLKEWNLKNEEWDFCLTFEQPDSHTSFKIMEDFTESLKDRNFRAILRDILSDRKPFANFRRTIDNSHFREKWFEFKNQWMKEYIWEVMEREMIYIGDDEED